MKPSILTIDIETSPLRSYHWGLYDQNIGLDMIESEWSILSYAAKYLNKDKVIYRDTSGRGPNKVRNDIALLKDVRDLLDKTDIVVAQNGKRFDIKKINARLIMAGLPPYSPIRVVDTLVIAKRHFEFTSNKLAWTSKYLTTTPKSEHKLFPGFELWQECLKDNPKAWAEMKKYNIRDVIATEQLYLTLLPWISDHPNMGLYTGEIHACPKCGSTAVQKRGESLTQSSRYQRYQCTQCGGWSRGKTMLTDLETRRGSLVPV